MVWESMEEKGFISCDNKIGLGKAIPLYLCAGLFDRTDISIDWSPFTSEYDYDGYNTQCYMIYDIYILIFIYIMI